MNQSSFSLVGFPHTGQAADALAKEWEKAGLTTRFFHLDFMNGKIRGLIPNGVLTTDKEGFL